MGFFASHSSSVGPFVVRGMMLASDQNTEVGALKLMSDKKKKYLQVNTPLVDEKS